MIEGYLLVALISLLPWVELRGAIPVGIIALGLNPLAVFGVSVLANVASMLPVLLGLEWGYSRFRRYAWVERCVRGVRERGREKIERYGFWGLAAFVSLPLPVTGAWTGTLLGWLFGLERKRVMGAVALGVITAGVIVTALSLFAAEMLHWLGLL